MSFIQAAAKAVGFDGGKGIYPEFVSRAWSLAGFSPSFSSGKAAERPIQAGGEGRSLDLSSVMGSFVPWGRCQAGSGSDILTGSED